MSISLFDWQISSALQAAQSVFTQGVVADGSDTGTGKTYKVCWLAKEANRELIVVCPKAVMLDWQDVAQKFGVPITTYNYEKARSKKGIPHGGWEVPGKVYKWKIPPNAILVFDEAHNCGGMKTQNAALLIAATRQKIPRILSSATLMASPMKGYAIGYALGLHALVDYWTWAKRHDVRQGHWGMEWAPGHKIHFEDPIAQAIARKNRQTEIMENIRKEMGSRFTRIRKADVPGFPANQIIPVLCETTDMPDLESDYGVEARQAVELEKVPAILERTAQLVHEEGMSVAVFVNFRATLDALLQEFPDAALIRGGQNSEDRATHCNRFQQNTAHVILVMAQAGGTGLSLHDLHGRPRAAIISPGWSAVEFLQILGRIHRAGALSPAVNYVLFASGVPVERRIRARLEQKLKNIETLNDHDLESPMSAAPVTTEPNVFAGLPAGHAPVAAQVAPVVAQVVAPAATTQHTATHGERKHARCSPSKLKNLEICPSYESDNSSPPHPVTLRGTAMHEALEKGDDSALLTTDALTGLPSTVEQDLVNAVRDYIEAEKEAYGIEQVIDEAHLKTHDKDVRGFADRIMVGPKKASGMRTYYIRDYKFGFNIVDLPSVNPQAIAYSVAVFQKYDDADEVHFAFMIPRIDAILEHTFTRADLPAMMLRISTIAERVRQFAGKHFNPVDENCLYCGRKASCVRLHEKALVIANNYNEETKLPLPAQFHSSEITDPADMGKAMNVAYILEKWCESVRAHALKMRLDLGVEIPGWSLIERQGKRSVINPTIVFDKALEAGITDEEFMSACTVSLPDLEKLVMEKAEHGTKAKKGQEFVDTLIDLNAATRGHPYHMLQKERKKKATKNVTPEQNISAASAE